MIYDVVVDTLFEENVVGALQTLGAGRLIMAATSDGDEEPFLTPEDGYLVVRVLDRDPFVFARELERRVPAMRIVTIVDRTPKE